MKQAAQEFNEFVLFTQNENNALESPSGTREVRGKPTTYVNCLVRNKAVQLKFEERTRQLWLARLIDQYGYAPSRIQVEYPITFGRDSSKRADIVVFDADRPRVTDPVLLRSDRLYDGLREVCDRRRV